ncbi:roadblock/LC7 domain-containing protein, partial [Streptomyces griseus]|uniref:roadblock/LC7 domain-containing protein n=1 Tax=Streptomyces griseus TaxID=1911 RepID=UPI001C569E00
MTAPSTFGLSNEARNLHWLLSNLVEEVPGVHSVTVVSSDGLMLLSSDPGHLTAPAAGPAAGKPDGPKGSSADLATIVSGIGSLTVGAAKLMDGGGVKQTMVAMDEGSVFVMSISDGSLLGVHAAPDCDMSVVAYHMALFVGRAGHVLTPELRSE